MQRVWMSSRWSMLGMHQRRQERSPLRTDAKNQPNQGTATIVSQTCYECKEVGHIKILEADRVEMANG